MAEKRAMSTYCFKANGFLCFRNVFGQDESEDWSNNNNTTDSNSNSNKLPKDRFDKAIKAYKIDPEGVKKELRKYILDAPQLTILKQNKIDLK